MELFDVGTSAFLRFYFLHANDLNRMGSCTMSGAHIPIWKNEIYSDQSTLSVVRVSTLTALCDSSGDSHVSILAVHVMCTTSRIISQPYSDISDFRRFLVVDLHMQSCKTWKCRQLPTHDCRKENPWIETAKTRGYSAHPYLSTLRACQEITRLQGIKLIYP